jgi:hypothetical protein
MIVILSLLALVAGLCGCQSEFDTSLPGLLSASRDQANHEIPEATGTADERAAKAHLYVFLGQVRGVLFSHANGRTSDFYINGVYVGTIGRAECLYLDLEPGVYDFSWRAREAVLGRVRSSSDADMLQPNQEVLLALNIERNAGALLGPIGWWLDPDRGHIENTPTLKRDIVQDHRILRPGPAVLAQIHPIAGPLTNLPPSW